MSQAYNVVFLTDLAVSVRSWCFSVEEGFLILPSACHGVSRPADCVAKASRSLVSL